MRCLLTLTQRTSRSVQPDNMESVSHAVDRSNYFKVRDTANFRLDMDAVSIKWWDKECADGTIKVAIAGSPLYNGCFPWFVNDEQGLPEPYDIRKVLQEHVHPDDAVILVGVASQGIKYLDGWASIVTFRDIQNMTLSEWVAETLESLGRKASDFHY